MRFLSAPNEGIPADNDQMLLFKFRGSLANGMTLRARNQSTTLKTLIAPVSAPGYTTSPYNPNTQAASFSGSAVCTTTPLDDYLYLSRSAGNDGYSVGLAYDFTATSSRAVVLEHSTTLSSLLPVATASASPLRLTWDPASSMFELAWAVGVARVALPLGAVPKSGYLGLDVRDGNTKVDVFHNGFKLTTASTATTNGVPVGAGSSASSRWVIGGSTHSSSAYATPGMLLTGTVADLAVWRRPLGDAKHRANYASFVRPWDELSLIETGSQKAVVRVEVATSATTDFTWTSLNDFHGRDFVQSVKIKEGVEDPTATATIVLHRRLGRFDDLSPLNSEQEFPTTILPLRGRVRISRAIVPALWQIQGWEFNTRFEGHIDSWAMTDEDITLTCSDLSAPLMDAFISETKGYNYSSAKSMEVVHSELLSEYEPRISRTKPAVGYRGYGAGNLPKNYTLSGTVATTWLNSSGMQINWNDVSSGPVLTALRALTDQIGYETKFVHHDPWSAARLTSYAPRRNRVIPHNILSLTSAGTTLLIEFREPHGLALGASLTVAGTTAGGADCVGSVASVLDYYRVNLGSTTVLTSLGNYSSGSVSFSYSAAVSEDNIFDIGAVSTDIHQIRNSVNVRINRADKLRDLVVLSATTDSSKILTLTVSEDLDNIDKDSLGVTFEFKATDGTALTNAGSFTGVCSGNTFISTVPAVTPSATLTSSTTMFVSCHQMAFQQFTTTASTSVDAYGLLPMAIYEGSNGALDTAAEAVVLGQAIMDDVSFPTMDASMTSLVMPVETHDIILLPALSNGRWTTPQQASIVSIEEAYEGGKSIAQYGLRHSKPTRGIRWVRNMLSDDMRPSLPNNNPADVFTEVRDSVRVGTDRGRGIRITNRAPRRREMGLRHDRTDVWLGTNPDFVPSDSNLVGSFRGTDIEITCLADGTPLTPGTVYYPRIASRDIFNNISAISGLNSASAASLGGVRVRYTDTMVGSTAVAAAGAALTLTGTAYTPMTYSVDDGSDTNNRSFDNFNRFSTSSMLFRCPCDGTFLITSEQPYVSNGLKANGYVQATVARFNGSMVELSRSDPTTASYAGASGQAMRLFISEAVSASSGDYLRVDHRCYPAGGGSDIDALRLSTASATFGYATFQLLSQR